MTEDQSRNTWDQVLRRVQARVNPHSFNTWFKPTRFLGEDKASVRVRVPNDWFAEWLRSNYMAYIHDALKDLERPGLQVRFESDEERRRVQGLPARSGSAGASAPDGNGSPSSRGGNGGSGGGGPKRPLGPNPWLNPRYTFETFVVSSCNQFAHAAAVAVSGQPAGAYNPLYIYGGVGLGKTHLMQAIGNRIAADKPVRTAYVSSEHFMNQLINAIRFERTYEFKETYRNVDLLLIDDIQFLAGKERTQEEFFHTFNALYDSQKQIVMTSDVQPREIPTLEERLRSRFEWGLIADIQPPDLETKVAILRKKAEAERAKVPDDVALLIASNSKSNIRELEGALIRVIAYASMTGQDIRLDLAKETLKDFLTPEPPTVTVEAIQKKVATYYNLNISQLKSKNNSQQIALPRQIAMYLSKKHTNCSLPEIGRLFGGKHHSTVIHAIHKIERKRLQEKDFERLIQGLAHAIKK